MSVSRTSSAAAFLCALILLLMVSERPVSAYIDPGSGSLIYQTIITVLLGAGFVFRRALASVGRWFRRDSGDSHPPDR